MKKLIDWFKESNRGKHLIVGGILYCLFLIVGNVLGMASFAILTNATLVVLTAMMSVEFKDKSYGTLFDWKDILAGIIFPVVVDLCYILTLIIKLCNTL